MDKNYYSRPYLVIEKFEPNAYVASCEIPYNMIYSPVPENNGLDGWQQYNAPAGYKIDTDVFPWYINSQYLAVTSFTKEHFSASETEWEDDNESYYRIILGAEAKVYKKKNNKFVETGVVYPAGSIFYKNYNDNIFEGGVLKNQS